jgi:hypothetical protein
VISDNPELQDFAQRLVRQVRDRSIASCDQLAGGDVKGALGVRWKSLASRDSREALKASIPDVVDQVIFQLLVAIDNGQLPLGWRCVDGSCSSLDQLGHGEMAGWFMMGKGADGLNGILLSGFTIHWPIHNCRGRHAVLTT